MNIKEVSITKIKTIRQKTSRIEIYHVFKLGLFDWDGVLITNLSSGYMAVANTQYQAG